MDIAGKVFIVTGGASGLGEGTARMLAAHGAKVVIADLQAEAMKSAGVKLDVVLEIDVPDAAIIERMSGRRAHLPSGRTYHLKFNPPKVAGKDDVTGEDLVQREDDKEDTVRKRLEVYQSQTRPLVDYYSAWAASGDAQAPRYRRIDGSGSVEQITERAFAALA